MRQNLKDYILKIYRSIIDENNAVEKAKKKKENLTASVAGLFNSFNNNDEGGGDENEEIYRTFIKIQKTKKVLEMTV